MDAIIMALECSATNEKVKEQACRSLFILGGHFSYSGETVAMAWLLNEAGFCDGSEANSFNNGDEDMPWVRSICHCLFPSFFYFFRPLFPLQLHQLMLLPELQVRLCSLIITPEASYTICLMYTPVDFMFQA